MRLTKIFYYSSCALALFPILKLNHFSILMIIWFAVALVNAFKNKTFSLLKTHKFTFLVLAFLCLMYVFFIPFTGNFKELGKSITKSLPFLIFPLGFILNKRVVTTKMHQTFACVYIASVAVLNGLGWLNVFNFGWNNAWQQNDFYHPVFRNLFFNATSHHLPYLGLLTVFAALLLTYRLFHNQKLRVLNLVIISFLLFSTYIYSARMALACYLMGLTYMLYKSVKNQQLKWILLFAVPILSLTLLWFSPIKERYVKLVEKDLVLPHENQQPHEVNYRYGIWYCATQLVKNHYITGVGADKVQKELNECYNGFSYKSYEDFSKVTYNTHNQYLDQLLKFGVFGLILFLFVFLYFFNNSSVIYQTFILVILCSFLTENLLDRQIGVVFISLFNTIFVILKLNKVEKSISS